MAPNVAMCRIPRSACPDSFDKFRILKVPNYPQLNYLNLQQKPGKWFRLAKKPSPTPIPTRPPK
ncbi:hypothetical protein SBA4_350002 [Candidatus Sulfopaludibacter sp. SbA4]|nr:hypothetical protein SBA4_350002 [Candidatus Sulfopaludibacter sp. SbA4]